jgi:hypothetical protein
MDIGLGKWRKKKKELGEAEKTLPGRGGTRQLGGSLEEFGGIELETDEAAGRNHKRDKTDRRQYKPGWGREFPLVIEIRGMAKAAVVNHPQVQVGVDGRAQESCHPQVKQEEPRPHEEAGGLGAPGIKQGPDPGCRWARPPIRPG